MAAKVDLVVSCIISSIASRGPAMMQSAQAPIRCDPNLVHGERQARPQSSADLILSSVPTSICKRFKRNTEVFGQGEAAEYLYAVGTGAVRAYKILDDGRRQIGSFYFPGDVFGIEAGITHQFSTDAIVDSDIVLVKRPIAAAMGTHDQQFAYKLWIITAEQLEQAQEHSVLLGRKNARERMASFLVNMARRGGLAGNAVDLPMLRQDIADYLGLTIETVSRRLTDMVESDTLELASPHRVRLRNVRRLVELNH
jgi:CRP/FNR family nitrogen fixation transcriptional regulator